MQKERNFVVREDVEELLGCEITDEQFEQALEYAIKKQVSIVKIEARPETLQNWYLIKLTEECVRNLAFSMYTMELCRKGANMEKERQVQKNLGTPPSNHIVTDSV